MALNFPPNPTEGQTHFDPSNGVTYTYKNGGWVASGGTQDDLDLRYVLVAGDNMTGDLTLGTDKITLKADGSITAAASVQVAGDPNTGVEGTKLSTRQVSACSSPSRYIYTGFTEGNTSVTFAVKADGTTTLGGLPSAPNITLNANGKVEAASSDSGHVLYRKTSVTSDQVLGLYSDVDGTKNRAVGFAADGSITATGTIKTTGQIIQCLADPYLGANSGTQLRNGGFVASDTGSNPLFLGYTTGGGSSSTVRIEANGSITAAGGIRSEGDAYLGNAEGVLINGGPDRDFSGSIDVCRDGTDEYIWKGWLKGNNTLTSSISAGGSITAAGKIETSVDFSLQSGVIADPYNPTANISNVIRADQKNAIDQSPSLIRMMARNALANSCWWDIGTVSDSEQYRSAFVFHTRTGSAEYAERARFDKVGNFLLAGALPAAPNISLNANGSATFAGNVKVGSASAGSAAGIGARVDSYGYIMAQRDGSGPNPESNLLFEGYYGSDNVFSVTGDGSAEFAGSVFTGAYSAGDNTKVGSAVTNGGGVVLRNLSKASSAPAISIQGGTGTADQEKVIDLNTDGSAKFGNFDISSNAANGTFISNNGQVSVQREASTPNAYLLRGFLGNSETFNVKADGSAEFAGAVMSGGYQSAGNGAGVVIAANGSISINSNSGGGQAITINNASGARDKIVFNRDGSATFTGTVTATVVPPSDARFKENITPAKPQLADVVALGGLLKNYDWNDQAPLNEEIRSQRQLGLIAQEAAEVCPAIVKDIHRTKTVEVTPAVTGPKGRVITEAVTEEVDDSYKGISQDALIMKLIGAVTELKAELDALKGA